MYTAIIESSIELASKIFDYFAAEADRKYLKELRQLKDQYFDEISKPYGKQNDHVIETLTARISNLSTLASIELERAKKNGK